MDKTGKNIALVLSGGGARGMAHIGVIEELLKHGYNITSIAGTSIGSVVGGVYASGKLDAFKEWVTSVGKFEVFKLMDFVISKNGFIKGEKVFNILKKFLSDVNIEDLEIPYAAVAVDINNHKEIVFTEGNLINAIRASIAIPTVLQPKKLQDLVLVDGGVLNPLPLDCVKRNPNDLLVAVDLSADIPYKKPRLTKTLKEHDTHYQKAKEFINTKWTNFFKNEKDKEPGFFDVITESIFAMQMKITKVAIAKYKPDLVVDISRFACDLFEFHRSEELIDYGRKQFLKSLSANK